jgi:hypothetical protein
MNAKQIADDIISKYSSTHLFSGQLLNGRPLAKIVPSKLLFDISDKEPEDTSNILQWYLVDGADLIVEVLTILKVHDDHKEIKKWVFNFIDKYNLTNSNNLYIISYLSPV